MSDVIRDVVIRILTKQEAAKLEAPNVTAVTAAAAKGEKAVNEVNERMAELTKFAKSADNTTNQLFQRMSGNANKAALDMDKLAGASKSAAAVEENFLKASERATNAKTKGVEEATKKQVKGHAEVQSSAMAAADGAFNLARGMMLMGMSGSESAEQMVQTIAKVQGAVDIGKGLFSLGAATHPLVAVTAAIAGGALAWQQWRFAAEDAIKDAEKAMGRFQLHMVDVSAGIARANRPLAYEAKSAMAGTSADTFRATTENFYHGMTAQSIARLRSEGAGSFRQEQESLGDRRFLAERMANRVGQGPSDIGRREELAKLQERMPKLNQFMAGGGTSIDNAIAKQKELKQIEEDRARLSQESFGGMRSRDDWMELQALGQRRLDLEKHIAEVSKPAAEATVGNAREAYDITSKIVEQHEREIGFVKERATYEREILNTKQQQMEAALDKASGTQQAFGHMRPGEARQRERLLERIEAGTASQAMLFHAEGVMKTPEDRAIVNRGFERLGAGRMGTAAASDLAGIGAPERSESAAGAAMATLNRAASESGGKPIFEALAAKMAERDAEANANLKKLIGLLQIAIDGQRQAKEQLNAFEGKARALGGVAH